MQGVQAPLPAGTVIRKRYIVEALLGKGGSGAVYLVRDLRNKNAQHNLFVLKEVIVPNGQERCRLFREAVLLRELHHGGLPRMYQVFNDDKSECVYLLMEYIEGQNLEKLRQKQPEQQFLWNEVMSIMVPIVATVSYLHHQQPPIIHGDIKPTNIIVLKTGFIRSVLVDYSLVKAYDAIPPPAHSHLPSYKAPEHHTGGAGIQSDIYGLGATSYTLLTGIVPVDALSRMALLDNEGVDPLKQVNEVVPTVPVRVGKVVDQALSLDAHNRFSSVDQFWEAFWSLEEQPLLAPGSLPVASSRPSAIPKQAVARSATLSASTQPRVPRPWKLAVPFILLILLIGLGFGLAFWIPVGSHLAAHATIPTPEVMVSPPISTSTSASGIYPSVAGTYNGTIFDVATNIGAPISLSKIQQNQAHISGYLTIGSKLQGSGPFSGTIDAAKRLQFIVTDSAGRPVLFFEGAMQSSTSLSGDYYRCSQAQGNRCLRGPGDYGIWNVVLESSGSSLVPLLTRVSRGQLLVDEIRRLSTVLYTKLA